VVKERQFHPTQKLTEHKNGSIELEMTAGGLDEVVYWVLSWGPYAQVLSPPKLVKAVREQLETARELYAART
jgi:proteasome accessory factor B